MNADLIQEMIAAGLPDAEVVVTGSDGHFHAEIISESFVGQSRIKRHQMVNATVQEHIASGALHALSMRTRTPEEAA
ncbi:Acid stress-induced BolA-like protein IbaG/YrbA, predicted regulator of iron metabolism [Ectothiorhodosinus mongolicus]|uniref:Acid stress-induced BolA-like protein IbaG/YrbA, predicted regulator of iron metabolism n=1 Tax=Ectothiorhodosinus mongolicus TaxID=233100 RepID=A0A1R3VWS5_9GAMM|nr:BolA/IbaG family iron-sulfur metabolism protein [Ectothiorhodosinus mongolicus]ULX56899.1 hypothetical protein CKX93_03790 [Ectothiorhodosinus mongolicus]SIT68880.1 Acid stress-induced BolA-like protein IbaG/YrbA, predicted regulator of iron metabolism [Ectothiorhodosinus mongolicus]